MPWATVPICDDCWATEMGDRVPHRIVEGKREDEWCYHCGRFTLSGIYVRREVS